MTTQPEPSPGIRRPLRARRPLAELVRRPDPPAAPDPPAPRAISPDESLARLEAANEMLAKARRDFALWMEESARQRVRWTEQMNAQLENRKPGKVRQ